MNFGCAICFLVMYWLSLQSAAFTAPDATHAAAVLFKNFETVFHTVPDFRSGSLFDGPSELTTRPFEYLAAGLDAAHANLSVVVMQNGRAVLVGTKRYRVPLGLGAVRSTRCYVVVLAKGSELKLSRYFNQIEVARVVTNAPVWHWQAKLQEFGEDDTRASTLFATQIANSYVVVSNDLQELLKISMALESGDKYDAQILQGIRQWQEMKQHRFWGYRKYEHAAGSGLDRIYGLGGVARSADALSVYVETERRRIILVLFSSDAKDPTAANINKTYSIPPLKSVGSGVWEADLPLTHGGSASDDAEGILWLFGWGVVV